MSNILKIKQEEQRLAIPLLTLNIFHILYYC